MTEIKVGDSVTYQKPSYQAKDGNYYQPLGLAGCKVTEMDDGVARLEWQGFFDKDGPERFQAPLEWLTKED